MEYDTSRVEPPHSNDGADEFEATLRLKVKAELRKSMQRTRSLLQPSARRVKSELICDKVRALGLLHGVRNVALFRAIGRKGELDTERIDVDARALGVRVAYPALLDSLPADPPQSPTMIFRFVDVSDGLDAAFEDRGRGFPEPDPGAPIASYDDLDLVIVPALAYDPAGYRIGYGAGYYDRTLPHCTRAKKIGVCFDFQLIAEVPITAGDVPVSLVVTEARTLTTTAGN